MNSLKVTREEKLWVAGYALAKYEQEPKATPKNYREAGSFWEGFEVGAINIIQYQEHPEWSLKTETIKLFELLADKKTNALIGMWRYHKHTGII